MRHNRANRAEIKRYCHLRGRYTSGTEMLAMRDVLSQRGKDIYKHTKTIIHKFVKEDHNSKLFQKVWSHIESKANEDKLYCCKD